MQQYTPYVIYNILMVGWLERNNIKMRETRMWYLREREPIGGFGEPRLFKHLIITGFFLP